MQSIGHLLQIAAFSRRVGAQTCGGKASDLATQIEQCGLHHRPSECFNPLSSPTGVLAHPRTRHPTRGASVLGTLSRRVFAERYRCAGWLGVGTLWRRLFSLPRRTISTAPASTATTIATAFANSSSCAAAVASRILFKGPEMLEVRKLPFQGMEPALQLLLLLRVLLRCRRRTKQTPKHNSAQPKNNRFHSLALPICSAYRSGVCAQVHTDVCVCVCVCVCVLCGRATDSTLTLLLLDGIA